MPSKIRDITDSNAGGDAALLGEAVHRIDHRTAEMARRLESMEARMTTLLGAFETGGLRGFRQAARAVRGG